MVKLSICETVKGAPVTLEGPVLLPTLLESLSPGYAISISQPRGWRVYAKPNAKSNPEIRRFAKGDSEDFLESWNTVRDMRVVVLEAVRAGCAVALIS
jgi:hypothetical protein